MAKVKIGGNERTIAPFCAAKAMEASALVAEIVEHGNGIFAAMDDYAVKSIQRTTIKVPRASAFYKDPERAAAVPADAWEASGNVLEVPGPRPSFEEQLLGVFPQLFGLAREQVLKLLALVLVDDAELESADREGGIDELLKAKGRELLYQAQMEEFFSLMLGAWEACQEQLRADPTAQALLGRLGSLLSQQRTASSSGPGSSTGSQPRTGGAAKKSSSGSRGASSKRSTVNS